MCCCLTKKTFCAGRAKEILKIIFKKQKCRRFSPGIEWYEWYSTNEHSTWWLKVLPIQKSKKSSTLTIRQLVPFFAKWKELGTMAIDNETPGLSICWLLFKKKVSNHYKLMQCNCWQLLLHAVSCNYCQSKKNK